MTAMLSHLAKLVAVGRLAPNAARRMLNEEDAGAPLHQPDAFERIEFTVSELDSASLRIVGQLVKLRAARIARNASHMREALVELQRLYSQSSQLAGITHRAVSGGA